MKIKQKLILGFAGIASFVGIMGYLSTYVAQKVLLKTIGENTMFLAIETIDKIDREIYHITEDFQDYSNDSTLQQTVAESNREFDKLENIGNYIDKIDAEWASLQITNTAHLPYKLINNEVSKELGEKVKLHEQNLEYKVLDEVLVTNKYGATIALTDKTSDYKQDNEKWWQKAKEEGLYINEAEFDESARIYATVIAIRIEDKESNFAGVLKIVSDISKTIDTIKKTIGSQKYHIAQIKLLTTNGRMIYDTHDEFAQFNNISKEYFFSQMEDSAGYFLKKADEKERKEGSTELMAYAKSQSSKSNRGLGWILAIEYQTKKLFAPITNLRNIIAGVSFALTISAITIGLLISISISKSMRELVQGASVVGEGNLTHKVNIKTKDELGELANAFNMMTENLRKVTVSYDTLKQEITERKKAEEALLKSQERFKQVAENAGDWIWEVNAEGLYTYSNSTVEYILGYKPEEIVGKMHFYDLFDPKLKEELKQAALEAFAKGESFTGFTNPNIHKNGSTVIMETNGTPVVDDNGNICGYRGLDRDITERTRAEEALRDLNEKLIQSNQQLQEFTYVASHDLREPTRKINSFGQMLAESVKDKLSDDDKENLHFMIDGAERMQQMIEALLVYSRVSTKGVASGKVDLNEVIEQLEDLELSAKLEETKGGILVPEPLPQVFADPAQIRQLLQNLISNALKYHKKDVAPEVIVRAKTQDNCMLRVEIRDNGIGIKREQFKNAFVMFRRLNSRDEYEGTGIGLAVCKRIVERHGGQIGIESTYGQGSIFWFTIPAADRINTEETESLTAMTAG